MFSRSWKYAIVNGDTRRRAKNGSRSPKKTKQFLKEKGFSEFNNSPLKDTECTNLTEEKMKYVKLQYDCLVDNFENIETIGEYTIQFNISYKSLIHY